MMELFNTPFETALRVLLLLEVGTRPDYSMNTIAAVDFAALYGRSFGFSDKNLHGDNLFKYSEFATRKELTKEAITILVRRGLVEVVPTRSGFMFRITESGRTFSRRLDTRYAQDYRGQIGLALRYFSNDSEQMILNRINALAVASLEEEASIFHEE